MFFENKRITDLSRSSYLVCLGGCPRKRDVQRHWKGQQLGVHSRDFLFSHLWLTSLWGKKFLEMNVTLVHYTGLEVQGGTNTTAPFAQEAKEEKTEASLSKTIRKKINIPKEKWPKAINRPSTEEEPEQSTKSRKRLNSMSNQGNAK